MAGWLFQTVFLFSLVFRDVWLIDSYFRDGFQPPTRCCWWQSSYLASCRIGSVSSWFSATVHRAMNIYNHRPPLNPTCWFWLSLWRLYRRTDTCGVSPFCWPAHSGTHHFVYMCRTIAIIVPQQLSDSSIWQCSWMVSQISLLTLTMKQHTSTNKVEVRIPVCGSVGWFTGIPASWVVSTGGFHMVPPGPVHEWWSDRQSLIARCKRTCFRGLPSARAFKSCKAGLWHCGANQLTIN